MEKYVISVEEAAEITGITVEVMKRWLIEGASFGIAIRNDRRGKIHYRYIIIKHRLLAYLKGSDLNANI